MTSEPTIQAIQWATIGALCLVAAWRRSWPVFAYVTLFCACELGRGVAEDIPGRVAIATEHALYLAPRTVMLAALVGWTARQRWAGALGLLLWIGAVWGLWEAFPLGERLGSAFLWIEVLGLGVAVGALGRFYLADRDAPMTRKAFVATLITLGLAVSWGTVHLGFAPDMGEGWPIARILSILTALTCLGAFAFWPRFWAWALRSRSPGGSPSGRPHDS